MSEVIDWLGLSGLLAMIGAVFGYGHLHSRVKATEDAVTRLADREDKSVENAQALARLEAKFEERTAAILREIRDMKDAR